LDKISRRQLIGGLAGAAALGTRVAAALESLQPGNSQKAPFDISFLPLLDQKQAGHLRHLRNISNQPSGVWNHMRGPFDHMGGGIGPALYKVVPHSYFALALAYYNRLPAAPGVFRPTSERLIAQMLDKEVWGYWRLMSTSSKEYDPDLKVDRDAWSDPVVKENIMYSGRLAMMLGLHSVLFNDDKYEKRDSIVLDWDVPFSGGPAQFKYSLDSLNERIYQQLVESGFLGIPCEPNCVFVVCNQYGLISLRLRDIRKGTKVAEEVTAKFKDAWEKRGWIDGNGHLVALYQPNQDFVVPLKSPLWDFYAGTYMSAWMPEFVRSHYPSWSKYAYRSGPKGTLSPWPAKLIPAVKAAMENGTPLCAIDVRGIKLGDINDIGQMLAFVAEIGDKRARDGMLAHLDEYCNPTWEKGGLFYPRNDEDWDGNGNMVRMDPWTGSASAAHARLTTENGLWNIYNNPWGVDHFAQPALVEIDEDVDVLRANFVSSQRALVLTMQTWHGNATEAKLVISNIHRPGKRWNLYRDGGVVASGNVSAVSSTSLTKAHCNDGLLTAIVPVQSASTFVMQWS
jgi:hypothetical protein